MSEGLNKVIVLGNLGADPELRNTQGGQSVCNLRMACTESYVDKDGERQERTEWVRVVIWGKRGEALAKLLAKGSRVLVEGRLQTTSYDKDGEKRYSTDVIATNVVLCDAKKRDRDDDADADDDGRDRSRERDRGRGRDDERRGDTRGARGRDDRGRGSRREADDFGDRF